MNIYTKKNWEKGKKEKKNIYKKGERGKKESKYIQKKKSIPSYIHRQSKIVESAYKAQQK